MMLCRLKVSSKLHVVGNMTEGVKKFYRGLTQIAFPNVCVCCRIEYTGYHHQVCSFCLDGRFEDANPDNNLNTSNSILPEGVVGQVALWNFYKGGDLQHLIHHFKYERLVSLGVDMGRKLGQRVEKHPVLYDKISSNAVIVPIPLHYRKYRSRGFNQAYEIARGFQQVWSRLPICGKNAVVRTKSTRTQTGFSIQRRMDNLQGAFQINTPSCFTGRMVIVIDDVFTTGATTFEIAQTLLDAGSAKIIILTVAQV